MSEIASVLEEDVDEDQDVEGFDPTSVDEDTLVTREEAAQVLGVTYATICNRQRALRDYDPFDKAGIRGNRAVRMARVGDLIQWSTLFARGRRSGSGSQREKAVHVPLTEAEMTHLDSLVDGTMPRSRFVRNLIMSTKKG